MAFQQKPKLEVNAQGMIIKESQQNRPNSKYGLKTILEDKSESLQSKDKGEKTIYW